MSKRQIAQNDEAAPTQDERAPEAVAPIDATGTTETETTPEMEAQRVVLAPDPTPAQVETAVAYLLETEQPTIVSETASTDVVLTDEGRSAPTESPMVAEVRGILIGAGVANPDDMVGSVRGLLERAGQNDRLVTEIADERLRRRELEGAQQQLETVMSQIRETVADVQAPEGASLVETIRVLNTSYRQAMADVQRLSPLAEDGRTYRTDLVSDALLEGVRAHGAEFAEATYRNVLESASLEIIKRMRDDWRQLANSHFAPGRVTTDGGSTQPADEESTRATEQAPAKSDVPNAAFQG